MNKILIGSPDKISLNQFVRFLKRSLNEYSIGILHSLMSMDSVQLYINEFLKQHPKAMFIYYAKRKINTDPLLCFPTYAQKIADIVIWFDLYSLEPKVVKDRFNVMEQTIDDWNKYVISLSGR